MRQESDVAAVAAVAAAATVTEQDAMNCEMRGKYKKNENKCQKSRQAGKCRAERVNRRYT